LPGRLAENAKSNRIDIFVLKWGSSGSSIGKFSHALGIAVNKADEVYVVDYNNDNIQKFNSSGAFILKWGKYGSDPSEFKSPMDIAVDDNGNIYVADYGNHRVQKFKE
jgi:DNA-binding beta-propeller fold protein YncE